MIEIADIFRLYAPQYLQLYGDRILPSHSIVIWRLCQCRTDPMGGLLWLCEPCDQFRYSYHSCLPGSRQAKTDIVPSVRTMMQPNG